MTIDRIFQKVTTFMVLIGLARVGRWSLLNRPPNYACIYWALCVFVCVYPCVSREAIKVIGANLREDESFVRSVILFA